MDRTSTVPTYRIPITMTEQQDFLDYLKNPKRKIIQDKVRKFKDAIKNISGLKHVETYLLDEGRYPQHLIRITVKNPDAGIEVHNLFMMAFPHPAFLINTSVVRPITTNIMKQYREYTRDYYVYEF